MDLTPYVEQLRQELAIAAEAGGDETRAVAERLTAPLESATRLTLLDALSAATDEITRDLAPGSVDVRIRGRDADFVVTPPPSTTESDEETEWSRTIRGAVNSWLRPSPQTGGSVSTSASPAAATSAASTRTSAESVAGTDAGSTQAVEPEDGGTSRITLRLPEQLKARAEEAANQEGLSVNAWLVRAVTAAVEAGQRGRQEPRGRSGQHYTGWVR